MNAPTVRRGRVFEGVVESIGGTPVVEIARLSPNPAVRLLAKLEAANPTGSVKDRVARALVEDLEASGRLKPDSILLEASLSFLGLGVTEPTPAWGLMLSGTSADFYQTAPWMILFPGVAITLAVFAFNLFGDSLRDWLDPKLKS